MTAGLLFCFLSAFSFGCLGSVSKLAERRKCNASALVLSVFLWAALFMLARTLALGAGFFLPGKASLVAAGCGICAAVATLAFQVSMKMGKVTVGWLLMNISAGLPAALSVWLYREVLTPLKVAALALALVAVLLLFWGHRMEAAGKEEGTNVVSADAGHSAH